MTHAEAPTVPPIHLYQIVLASLFIFVATLMTFVNSVNAEFVNWDDDVYVTENPIVQQLSADNIEKIIWETHFYAWIPLTLFSHACDVAWWGLNPKGHHLTNVLLHSCNALLFFVACMMMFDARVHTHGDHRKFFERLTPAVLVGSAAGAMLFAMHPQRVESVAWVSGRKDLLCAFFLLLSLGAHIRWKISARQAWRFGSLASFAFALMSKPAAAPFPFALILVDLWLGQEENSPRKNSPRESSPRENSPRENSPRDVIIANLKNTIPFFVLSLVVGVIALGAAAGGTENVVGELSRVERVMLPLYALSFYVWKMIVPLDLSPVYPEMYRWLLYASPVMLLVIGYACFVLWEKKKTGLVTALLLYALMLLPTFLGLRSGMQPLADRYSYLSTMSLFVFVGGSIEWLWRKSAASSGKFYQREMLFAVLLVVSAVSAFRTIRHTAIWNNSTILWSYALVGSPSTRDEFDERKPYMKPNYLDARINLGAALYAANQKPKAWEEFAAVLAFDSCNADAHYNLGMLLAESGNEQNAREAFAKTTLCDPSYAKAYHNLGVLYAQQDSVASVDMFRRAARLGFSDAQLLLRQRGIPW